MFKIVLLKIEVLVYIVELLKVKVTCECDMDVVSSLEIVYLKSIPQVHCNKYGVLKLCFIYIQQWKSGQAVSVLQYCSCINSVQYSGVTVIKNLKFCYCHNKSCFICASFIFRIKT